MESKSKSETFVGDQSEKWRKRKNCLTGAIAMLLDLFDVVLGEHGGGVAHGGGGGEKMTKALDMEGSAVGDLVISSTNHLTLLCG